MTRAFYQPPNPILKPTVKPISIGGTNSTTPTDAAVALNCVHAPDIGQPESGVPLNTNAIVPDQFITTMLFKAGDCLEGNFTVYTHQTVHFFISNYDCQRQYTISAENAAVSLVSWQNPIENLEPGTLVFVGPPTPGVYNLTINGEIYPITVVASYIEKPTFTFPSNNSIVHTQNMTFQISNFNPIGGPQTQTLMEFQASNNIDFTAPLRNSGSNNDPTSNIFTLSSNGGGENIYVRARYTGSYGLVSPWSDTVKVIVNVINWPTVESALLHSSDASGEEWFGNRVAMNQTGDRVIVGSIYDDLGAINATGAAYIFVKSGITWVQEAKLTSTDTATIKEFGNSVDISADGSVVVVGSWNEQINGLYCGVADRKSVV